MVEFAYNKAKHASTGYMLFELNCGYYLRISYKEDVDPRSRSKVVDELTKKLRNLMAAYRENLQHAQELENEPTIKELSLEVTLLARKFG